MLIQYKPLPENGEKIIKYGVAFNRDEILEVADEKLAKRLLTNAYFVECQKTDYQETVSQEIDAELTKRKRRTKAEMEAARNGENQDTSSDSSPSDVEGG